MYRVRNVIKVTSDGWNAAIENVQQVNAIAQQRGWQEATVWTQSFGPFGELCIEIDYPDLATYERESRALWADEECMKLMAEGMRYRRSEDWGYNEMWESAATVAGG